MRKFYSFIIYSLFCVLFFSCSSDKKQTEITKLDELSNSQFAVVTGTIADQLVWQKFPDAKCVYYNSPLDACVAVQKGLEKAAAYDEPILRNILAKNAGLKILPDLITVDNYGMAVRPQDHNLKHRADSLLKALKADGRYDDMMKRWFPKKGKPAPMPEMKWEGKNGVLKFGTSAVTEPFSFFDDKQQIVGFDIEFVSLLAQSLGMELEVQNMDFGALISSLLSNKSDIIGACMTITEERAKSVLFTEPYYKGGIAAVVKDYSVKEESNLMSDINDLHSKRIGVLLGSLQDEYVTEHFPNAEIIRIDLSTDLVTSLKQGQCDAILLDNVRSKFYMQKNNEFAFLDDAVTKDNFAIGFQLKNTAQRDLFNKFLQKIKTDGTYEEIYKRWIDNSETAEMPSIYNTGKNGSLRIGTTGESIPFSFVKGNQVVGFDLELMLRFAAEQQLKPIISTYNFGGLLAAIISGKVDIIGNSIMVTEERAKEIAFSDPYFETTSGMVVMKKNLAQKNKKNTFVNDGSNIAVSKVGAMTGTTGEMYIRSHYPKAEVQCFDDIMDAVASLQAHKLDYVITAYTTALKVSNKNEDLVVLPKEYTDEYAAIAFPKNNTELLAQVNEVLTEFTKDGTLDQIISRWVRKDGSDYEITAIPKVKEGKPLIVAIAANREPMCFVSDNKIVGLDCELIERIAYKLGRPVQYYDMKFSALIAALESGKADLVISNMTATEERRKVVNFSEGYFVNPQVLLTVKDQSIAANDTEGKSFFARVKESFYNNIILEKRYLLLWNGLKVTFLISVMAALLGTLLGALVCTMRMSKNKVLQIVAKVYIDLLRGIPQVVLLMLMFYVIFAPLNISGVTVAIITFAMNFAAYVSEMFRTSIESVNKGQTEAGIAMGFSKVKTFFNIVLPQAVQRVLPVYKGEFIALVKMTAIVGYIAVQDLTKASDIIRSRTFDAFFPLIMVAILYFVLAWLLTFLLERVQLKTAPKRKRTSH